MKSGSEDPVEALPFEAKRGAPQSQGVEWNAGCPWRLNLLTVRSSGSG